MYDGFCGGTAGAPLCAANRESSSCWWENIQSAARSRLLLVSLRARDAWSLVKPMDMSIASPSSLGLKLSLPPDGKGHVSVSCEEQLSKDTGKAWIPEN